MRKGRHRRRPVVNLIPVSYDHGSSPQMWSASYAEQVWEWEQELTEVPEAPVGNRKLLVFIVLTAIILGSLLGLWLRHPPAGFWTCVLHHPAIYCPAAPVFG